MDPVGLVVATERLYRSLFTAAVGFAAVSTAWGLAIVPVNGFDHHKELSMALGVIALVVALAAVAFRRALFDHLRRQPGWLLAAAGFAVAVLWIDGGWRSSYYVATYGPIAIAAVAAGLRWSIGCSAILVVGYLGGLMVNGYSWDELKVLHDADSVVANSGGYFLAAYFFAAPVAWLAGYVARINQVVGMGAETDVSNGPAASATRRLTDRLSVREVEVVQLAAAGATNQEIADRLVLSPRTIQSHVKNATEKTETRNRTELAVLAVLEGLVPARNTPTDALPSPDRSPL